jgi:ribonuclease-3
LARKRTDSGNPDFSGLEERLGYTFENRELIMEAVTHASFSNENSLSACNERLEFLGDAVLELCVSEILYHQYPLDSEGDLSERRASIVCEDSLGSWARHIDLREILRLGKGLSRSGGKDQPVICADAAEALFGAVFLDGGFEAARNVIDRFFRYIVAVNGVVPRNPKAQLQETMESMGYGKPEYSLSRQSGPPHAPVFVVTVSSSGRVIGEGEGRTIREAERKAAEMGLVSFRDQ